MTEKINPDDYDKYVRIYRPKGGYSVADYGHEGELAFYKGSKWSLGARCKGWVKPEAVPKLMAVLALMEPTDYRTSDNWDHFFLLTEEFEALVEGANIDWFRG